MHDGGGQAAVETLPEGIQLAAQVAEKRRGFHAANLTDCCERPTGRSACAAEARVGLRAAEGGSNGP
ncbi:hypothetical protein GCM10010377_42650 [Streptomyces viridiviolaceus]|nr:hypothetical protein GCM10010377_42650 [Streptomyces viridiviolaceus]